MIVGTIVVLAGDVALAPYLLVANTVKVYAVSLVRPVTVHVREVVVQVLPATGEVGFAHNGDDAGQTPLVLDVTW